VCVCAFLALCRALSSFPHTLLSSFVQGSFPMHHALLAAGAPPTPWVSPIKLCVRLTSHVCLPPRLQKIFATDGCIPEDVPLSAECAELIQRIFVVEPPRRISLPHIKRHPWFLHNLPIELQVGQWAITEINRIHLVLFGMQNRPFGPYLAAVGQVLGPACVDTCRRFFLPVQHMH
jgi:hypothetical protein